MASKQQYVITPAMVQQAALRGLQTPAPGIYERTAGRKFINVETGQITTRTRLDNARFGETKEKRVNPNPAERGPGRNRKGTPSAKSYTKLSEHKQDKSKTKTTYYRVDPPRLPQAFVSIRDKHRRAYGFALVVTMQDGVVGQTPLVGRNDFALLMRYYLALFQQPTLGGYDLSSLATLDLQVVEPL